MIEDKKEIHPNNHRRCYFLSSRNVYENGSLFIRPFRDYSKSIHAGTFVCRAENAAGSIQTTPIQLKPRKSKENRIDSIEFHCCCSWSKPLPLTHSHSHWPMKTMWSEGKTHERHSWNFTSRPIVIWSSLVLLCRPIVWKEMSISLLFVSSCTRDAHMADPKRNHLSTPELTSSLRDWTRRRLDWHILLINRSSVD